MITDRMEGKQHAISIISGALLDHTKPEALAEVIKNLRAGADEKPGDYRLGILEVVELVEGKIRIGKWLTAPAG